MPTVTPATLRMVAGEFARSAELCRGKGWPALADHERDIAESLTKAAEILEKVDAIRSDDDPQRVV